MTLSNNSTNLLPVHKIWWSCCCLTTFHHAISAFLVQTALAAREFPVISSLFARILSQFVRILYSANGPSDLGPAWSYMRKRENQTKNLLSSNFIFGAGMKSSKHFKMTAAPPFGGTIIIFTYLNFGVFPTFSEQMTLPENAFLATNVVEWVSLFDFWGVKFESNAFKTSQRFFHPSPHHTVLFVSVLKKPCSEEWSRVSIGKLLHTIQ